MVWLGSIKRAELLRGIIAAVRAVWLESLPHGNIAFTSCSGQWMGGCGYVVVSDDRLALAIVERGSCRERCSAPAASQGSVVIRITPVCSASCAREKCFGALTYTPLVASLGVCPKQGWDVVPPHPVHLSAICSRSLWAAFGRGRLPDRHSRCRRRTLPIINAANSTSARARLLFRETGALGSPSRSSGECTRRQRMDTGPAFTRGARSSRFFAGLL